MEKHRIVKPRRVRRTPTVKFNHELYITITLFGFASYQFFNYFRAGHMYDRVAVGRFMESERLGYRTYLMSQIRINEFEPVFNLERYKDDATAANTMLGTVIPQDDS